MRKSWKKLISVMLAVALILALAVPGLAVKANGGKSSGVTWEKVDNLDIEPHARKDGAKLETETAPQYADDEVVRVSIVLSARPTLEVYSSVDVAENVSAMRYRDGLRSAQASVESTISSAVLGGKALDVVWNLTLAANIISANVPYGKIAEIRELDGVEDVFVETRYEADYARTEVSDPSMSNATDMTGGVYAWDIGYTGAGSRVAIVDTGLDTDHQSFDEGAFDYAIAEVRENKDVTLLTADDVAAVLTELNAYERYEGLTANDVYYTSKVPFGFNYVDRDLDITHDNDSQGEHGSHVAGIAIANRYIPDGEGGFDDALQTVLTQGEAPDAQVIVMKVFGKGGGAYDSDYFAAVEDAIILGCDSVNLSLNSSAPGFAMNSTYAEMLDGLTESNIIWTNSAGNNSNWGANLASGGANGLGYLYADDNNFATGGSPGTYGNTMSVASVDNDGFTGAYFVVDDEMVFYTETEGYGNAHMTTIAGEQQFVYVDDIGSEEQFAAVADLLADKVAICNRGGISFYVKANAAVKYGAIGVIIANNQAGTISMDLTGYEYSAPAVSITQADAELFKYVGTEQEISGLTVYTGSFTVSDEIATVAYDSWYTMSDFSSWGVPGDLSLKPDITAPGGNIYSVNGLVPGGQAYENMSGTSMAAPQMAGIVALMAQYIRENDLVEKTGLTQRQLTTSLLMSTAVPQYDIESWFEYYPVIQQGSGLVAVDQAMNAETYLMMDPDATESAADGKIKVELGVLDEEVFEAGFTVYNLNEDEDVSVELFADFFTQDVFPYSALDYEGYPLLDDEENYIPANYLDTWTTSLDSLAIWTVDDEIITPYDIDDYDVNWDGVLDKQDVQAILDYVVGYELAWYDFDEDLADVDEDGDIDSYDAYALLEIISQVTVTVPAGGSVHVVGAFLVEMPEDLFADNGNYVEGYIYCVETTNAEGVIGVAHSIPVLGYYGNWTDASMFDRGSYLEYGYGLVDRYPYLGAVNGSVSSPAFGVQSFLGADSYEFAGNPFWWDTDAEGNRVYLPERNAVGPVALGGVRFTQIRNSGASRLAVTDADGNVLFEQIGGRSYGAYYYPAQGKWMSTYTTVKGSFDFADVPDGTEVTLSFTLAPEYYITDGEVDWDALGEGATMSYTAVVDHVAPEIEDVTYEDGVLTIKASDDRYVSDVYVQGYYPGYGWYYEIDDLPADVTLGAGEEITVSTEVDKDEDPYLVVSVYDYASNVSYYKINLNPEELNDPEALAVYADDVVIIGKGTAQLYVDVEPWSVENEEGFSLSFASDDETVATVDENGLVTAVAEETAECGIVITAAYKENRATYTANVEVKFFDKDLNAVIWDEEGSVWMSEFNLKSIPEYTKLTETPMTARLAALAYDQNDNLFGADLDTDDYSSNFYSVDPISFETTLIGRSEYGYFDMCAAPSFGENYMYAVYGPYVMLVDTTTGQLVVDPETGYPLAADLSDYTDDCNLVGIAFEELVAGVVDYVFLVDDSGYLYYMGFGPYNGSIGWTDPQYLGYIADEIDVPCFQSLYFDGEDIFWTRYNEADNAVNMILVDNIFSEAPALYDVGTFADGVWPVGGLIELDYNIVSAGYDSHVQPDAAFLEPAEKVTTIEKITLGKNTTVKAPGGSLNGIKEVPDKENLTFADELAENQTAVLVTADKEMTNGVVKLTYDPEKVEELTIISDGAVPCSSNVDEEKGEITFAFATLTAIPKDGPICEIVFTMKEGACAAAVTAGFTEVNADHIDQPEEEEIAISGHEYIQPKWTWTETDDGYKATALFTCEKCSEQIEVEAEVTGLEADGKIIFTATVTVEGETYTNKYIVDVAYKFVTAEVSWFSGDVTFTVKRNFNDASTFSRFVGVLIDGKEVEATNYVATAGSVNILFKEEYLDTLSKGVHELTVKMADGTATQKLYIKTAISPATGDQSNMTLWIVVAAVAVVALAGTVVILKKKSAAK